MNNLHQLKHCLTLFVCTLLLSVGAGAQTNPQWTYKTPKEKNNTYRYVVEKSGLCYSESDARNQAIAKVLMTACQRIGVPVNAQEINRAVQRGESFDVISSTYNLPINKVCEYTERQRDGYVRVFVLCQVAVSGNINVHFTEFRDCYTAQEFKDGNALLKSMFIPGLGQIGKRHIGEGLLTLAGEAALVGAGAYCYIEAQNKLDVMKSEGVSYADFTDARTTYNRLHDASYVIWGAAAGLYVFNLIRAYTIDPKLPKSISVAPTVLPTETTAPAPGVAMRIKF